MKKTLVIVAHPHIEKSVVNKRWIEELEKHPEQFTVHELYTTYPDGRIDVKKEQALIEQHDGLVLQFPLYWFNCTPLLKQWLDEVFAYGWAFGSADDKLKNKKIGLAVSAGISEKDFSENGLCRLTLEEVLRPFETTMIYVQADFQSFHAFYGAESDLSPERVNQNARDYIQFLSRFLEH